MALDFCLSHFPVVPLFTILCTRKNLRASKMIWMFYRRCHHMTHTKKRRRRKNSKKILSTSCRNSHKSMGITHLMFVWCAFFTVAAAAAILVVVTVLFSLLQFNVHVSNYNNIYMRQVSTKSVNHCNILILSKYALHST